MKVLAVNGSARKEGNTTILINTVFEELNKAGIETEMIQIRRKYYRALQSLLGVWRTKKLRSPQGYVSGSVR